MVLCPCLQLHSKFANLHWLRQTWRAFLVGSGCSRQSVMHVENIEH